MNPEFNQRAKDLFYAALDVAADRRDPFLREQCRDEPELLAEVQSLLRHYSDSTDDRFIDRPAIAAVAESVACPDERTPAGDGACVPGEPIGHVGNYELLGEIGRGGMAVVYRARQKGLNRLVALKMLPAAAFVGPERVARFQIEAEAVAQLQHPNIVQIYEIGQHEDVPYFSMELIDGGTLAERISGRPQPARQAAALVESLAHAMDYAHRRGVVHRDLKPANILLALGPEEAARPVRAARADNGVGWVPKVGDFGIAKRMEQDSGHTRIGAVLGTPSYMAPEQAEGRLRDIGTHTDVYALGVILYELLTGAPPHCGDNDTETLRRVISDDPIFPTRHRRELPRDLETIALTCLHKDPSKRYASAAALADDLARFLTGDPIRARPVGKLERAWRWARRKPATAALVCVLVLVLLAGPAALVWYNVNISHERDIATAASRSAALALFQLAYKEHERDPKSEVLSNYTKCAELLEGAAVRLPDDLEVRWKLVECHINISDIYLKMGQPREAIQAAQKARDLLSKVAERSPHHARVTPSWVVALGNVAEAYRELGEWNAARAACIAAEQWATGNDGSLKLKYKCLTTWASILAAQATVGDEHQRIAEAIRSWETARDAIEELIDQNPREYGLKDELAICQLGIGRLQRVQEKLDEAMATLRQSEALLAQLVRDHPRQTYLRVHQAAIDLEIAELLLAAGAWQDARGKFDQARSLLEPIERDDPECLDFPSELSRALEGISLALWQQGEKDEAISTYRQATRHRVDAAVKGPAMMRYQESLKHHNSTRERLERELGTEQVEGAGNQSVLKN